MEISIFIEVYQSIRIQRVMQIYEIAIYRNTKDINIENCKQMVSEFDR